MIHDIDVRSLGESVMLGIALENAVLDMKTTKAQLHACLDLLDTPDPGLARPQIGEFGIYPVSVNVDDSEMCSIIVDGPAFDPPKELCASIWLTKQELRQVIQHALSVLAH